MNKMEQNAVVEQMENVVRDLEGQLGRVKNVLNTATKRHEDARLEGNLTAIIDNECWINRLQGERKGLEQAISAINFVLAPDDGEEDLDFLADVHTVFDDEEDEEEENYEEN